MADLPDYDAGLLNDWGGGNVEWWQDYLRAEIGRANDHWREACADLIPRADANLAVAEAFRRAAEAVIAGDTVGMLQRKILALAPGDALAEMQRLRDERDELIVSRQDWIDKAFAARNRAEKAEAERDAALARVEKLRHQITEASEPDFIWGALDNVHDAETTLDDYAAAVSRAIRAALDEDARHA